MENQIDSVVVKILNCNKKTLLFYHISSLFIKYSLWKGVGCQNNSLKPPQDIYIASLKSTYNSDKYFLRSLASDKKNLTTLCYRIYVDTITAK